MADKRAARTVAMCGQCPQLEDHSRRLRLCSTANVYPPSRFGIPPHEEGQGFATANVRALKDFEVEHRIDSTRLPTATHHSERLATCNLPRLMWNSEIIALFLVITLALISVLRCILRTSHSRSSGVVLSLDINTEETESSCAFCSSRPYPHCNCFVGRSLRFLCNSDLSFPPYLPV